MALRSIPDLVEVGGATVGAELGFEPFRVVVVAKAFVVTATAEPLALVVWFALVVDGSVGAVFAEVVTFEAGVVGAWTVWDEGAAVVGWGAEVDVTGSASKAASVNTGARSGEVMARESFATLAALAALSVGSESEAAASASEGAGLVTGASMTSPSTSTLGVERSRTFGKITSSTASATRSKIPSRRRRSERSCDDLKPLT
jgi:hypothetical protein